MFTRYTRYRISALVPGTLQLQLEHVRMSTLTLKQLSNAQDIHLTGLKWSRLSAYAAFSTVMAGHTCLIVSTITYYGIQSAQVIFEVQFGYDTFLVFASIFSTNIQASQCHQPGEVVGNDGAIHE